MPYTVGCTPAPLTFTVRPKLGWETLSGIGWFVFVGYQAVHYDWHRLSLADHWFDIFVVMFVSFGALLSFIRRERIEIYSEQMVWRKTYFGITRTRSAPLGDILAAEWNEGNQHGEGKKGPDHVKFYLADGKSVQACYGFTFEDFDRFREDIRTMFPDVIKRWGQAATRSTDLTLLNLT
ncbi:MAG TPA: hypothetical protein VFU86_23265 [Terriglobales bacterium]|nr:hypothetical protein [Terriglobales bacterium]